MDKKYTCSAQILSTERSARAGCVLEDRRHGIVQCEEETNIPASFLQYKHSNLCKFQHCYAVALHPLSQHNTACLGNSPEEGNSFWALLGIVL